MTKQPKTIRVRLSAAAYEAAREEHGDGWAQVVRAALLDPPKGLDLRPDIHKQIWMPDEERDALDALAQEHGLSRAEVTRRLMDHSRSQGQ